MAKQKNLSLTKAVKYYKAGYPEDGFANLAYFKGNTVERERLIEEVTSFVNASDLQTACTLAVGYDYGTGTANNRNWRDHSGPISKIRKASGHYEVDLEEEGIVKDLIDLVKTLNDSLAYEDGDDDRVSLSTLLHSNKSLDERIELVYGRLWEGMK